jgi:sulfatase maturation enzyme AslB (radical SAM superfamily)
MYYNSKKRWSIVMIEMTSYCNFKCDFCPISKMERKKTRMPTRLWKKIIVELGEKKLTDTVFFHVLGEPLLNNEIFDAIKLANHFGIAVSLYTNGGLLNHKISKKLLDTIKIGRVVISMQSIDEKTFRNRSRGSISWAEYIKRIKLFVSLAEEHENQVPVQVHSMCDIKNSGWDLVGIFEQQKKIQAIYEDWKSILGIVNKKKINIFNPANVYPLGEVSSFFVKHAGNWDNKLIGGSVDVIPCDYGIALQ